MAPEEMAALLYEGAADDEGLRGALTDAGYAPLLRWVAARAQALASTADEVNLDRLTDDLRGAVRAIVAAAETGDAADLDALPPAIVPTATRARLAAVLPTAAADPDERAEAMAAVLQEPDA